MGVVDEEATDLADAGGPIGEGPNSATWNVIGSPGMWWSTIGTSKLALAWPGWKSIIAFTGVWSWLRTALPGMVR